MELQLNIDWSEMDLFGHVNNVAYFKYIQTARVNFCNTVGINTADITNKKSFAVAECVCDFKSPLYYPEEITIATTVLWIKNSSFQLQHAIYNSKKELCAFGKDVIVLFDYETHQKIIISDVLKNLLALHTFKQ